MKETTLNVTITQARFWGGLYETFQKSIIPYESKNPEENCVHCETLWQKHGHIEKDEEQGQLAWLVCPGDTICLTDKGIILVLRPEQFKKMVDIIGPIEGLGNDN